jgi:hypothetical protein
MDLGEALAGIMTALAKAHERAEPEFVDIAVMGLDVIADCRRLDDAALEAEQTQRVSEQLLLPKPKPAAKAQRPPTRSSTDWTPTPDQAASSTASREQAVPNAQQCGHHSL